MARALEHRVPHSGGRTLAVVEGGDPTGRPVFVLHGTPGSRVLFPGHAADAAARALRLISYDRPGYGGSTAAPGRTIGDTAGEVRTIADRLGLDRFAVWGFSGGGAPALACGALLGGRVVAVASVAGVAPLGAPGLDWFHGMGAENVEDFQLMLRDRAAWEEKTRRERDAMLAWDEAEFRHGFASLLSPVDAEALTGPLVAHFLRSMKEGLRPGAEGVRDDGLSVAAEWGFDLRSIRVPVQIWQGDEDRFVPPGHGRWLAAQVPGADAHLLPHEGHLTLFLRHVPQLHAWIESRF